MKNSANKLLYTLTFVFKQRFAYNKVPNLASSWSTGALAAICFHRRALAPFALLAEKLSVSLSPFLDLSFLFVLQTFGYLLSLPECAATLSLSTKVALYKKRNSILQVVPRKDQVCVVAQTVRTEPAVFAMLQIPMSDKSRTRWNLLFFHAEQLGKFFLFSHQVVYIDEPTEQIGGVV